MSHLPDFERGSVHYFQCILYHYENLVSYLCVLPPHAHPDSHFIVFKPQLDCSTAASVHGVHSMFSFDFPGIHYMSWLLEGGGWRRLQGWNISLRARSTLISQVLAANTPSECASMLPRSTI